MKKVFTENLPKLGRSEIKINWKMAVGYKIKFVYEDINGEFEILECIKGKTSRIKIKYKDNIFEIGTGALLLCRLGTILGVITKDFKVEIGLTFKDDKRDLIIIDREYRRNKREQNCKWYKYHCNKCGAELWMIENSLITQKYGCSCCDGKSVVKGINDIATTNPEMIKYFVNIENIYTHTYCSNQKVLMKCPECGYKKLRGINTLLCRGFSCPQCSDGISYPEKVMISVLNHLSINYTTQYSKINAEWCNSYKYDFNFQLNGQSYIIETHGMQHYANNSIERRTSKEEQQNDKLKKELAISNGIKEENYIMIDCRYSQLEFIKSNILKSKLNEIFDLDKIDWIKIGKDSEKTFVKEICEYWKLHNEINNKYLTTTDLGKIFKLDRHTVNEYLKRGTKLKWCDYNPKKEKSKVSSKNGKKHSKQVEIFEDGLSLGIFSSATELERQSEKLFNVRLVQNNISRVCSGKQSCHKGYTFKWVNIE